MFAFSSFLPKTSQEFVAQAPSAAGTSVTSAGFDKLPRSLPMEELTMAALVILSGWTLANTLLGA